MARSEQPDVREELRILTTQIETINQQLSQGGGGGGSSDAGTRNRLEQVEEKLNYLYELVKGLEGSVEESVKGRVEELGTRLTKSFNDGLAQVFARLDDVASADGGSSKDVLEIKRSLKGLIDVYKDEVAVFKEQNEFLQQKLIEIDKKLK